MQKHGLSVLVLGLMEELLFFQIDAGLRVVVHLSSLHRVVEEILELVVGGGGCVRVDGAASLVIDFRREAILRWRG